MVKPQNKPDRGRPLVTLCSIGILILTVPIFAQEPLVQVHQDFSGDAGWEGVNNRMICVDCPTKVQDFGWSPTAYSGSEGGEIGGTISNSRYQAYYAMPLGKPLSFEEAFSASGRLAIANLGLRGVGYFGFFNAMRHEWRPWSSMAIRIWEEDMEGQLMVDWMAGNWSAGGFDTDIFVPHDGSVHQWTFEYDPDALIDTNWEHPRMKDYLADEEQLEENLLAKAQADAPGLTRQEFRARLENLRDQGLVGYFQRHGRHRWWRILNPDTYQGRITFRVGDRRPYTVFIEKRIRNSPVEMDRFGIFNIQRYGEGIEMYLSGLTINGAKLDLSQDPHWVGHNNRVSYVEPDFQAMHNYGYSQTNWAGKSPGEVGGLFWRTEPEDPHFSYYADGIGELTMDDPISFSGQINFVTGMTDAAMYFGYFNTEKQTDPTLTGSNAGFPVTDTLGIAISDSTAVGYYFMAIHSSSGGITVWNKDQVFTPTRKPRHFSFDYDPTANGGVGQIRFSLDGKAYTLNLTAAQRADGAGFNRFGLANVRRGGNSVEVYLDDLTYTARRDPDAPPVRHKQKIVEVPYPIKEAGRRH